jgi:hypothetical protein
MGFFSKDKRTEEEEQEEFTREIIELSESVRPPVKRLWPEVGYLEGQNRGHLEQVERLAREDDGSMTAVARVKLRQIRDMIGRHDFNDRTENPFVFDIFEKEWGTEVRVFVWWAEWDGIRVTPFSSGFLIEIDLGPKRDIKMSKNFTMVLGGRHYIYYRQKGMDGLPRPKVQLKNKFLQLGFRGFVIPNENHSFSSGNPGTRSGNELLSHIEQELEDLGTHHARGSDRDPGRPKL